MIKKECGSQSFHQAEFYKGHYFVGCNYYGMIVDTKRCEKCKVKKIFETKKEGAE